MMRPLYVGSAAESIRLDGPALRVSAAGRADTRVPLRLLSRVVVRGRAEWSTSALTACLELGVPLIFLRPDGRPLGLCLPTIRRRSCLGQRLEVLEREPEGLAAFADWALAEERRAILAVTGHPPEGGYDLRGEAVHAAAIAESALAPGAADAMWHALDGMLAAAVAQFLLDIPLPGFRAATAAPGRIDLCGAFTAAGHWELVPTLHRAAAHRRMHPHAWASSRDRHRRLVRQFEAETARLFACMRRRRRRLETWLREREI